VTTTIVIATAAAAAAACGAADKIFIDIGGIAELHIVMSMVGCYFRAFKQAALIVKNKYFKRLLGSAQVSGRGAACTAKANGSSSCVVLGY
jgi:hypothetical protein